MGETENPHFYDFETFGRVPEPQNQYYSSLETPGYFNKPETNPEPLLNMLRFGNVRFGNVEKCWKGVSRTSRFWGI